MHSREQYLAALREEYLRGNKKQKTRLLNEARKRTKLNRKVLIRKLTRVPLAADKPKRRPRGKTYGVELRTPLIQVWELCANASRLVQRIRDWLSGTEHRGEAIAWLLPGPRV